MGYGFDQHLESLAFTEWIVLILLSSVAYLYYENKDLRRSQHIVNDYIRAKYEAEIKKKEAEIRKHEATIKMLMENKKESLKAHNTCQSKIDSQGSYVDCDFPF